MRKTKRGISFIALLIVAYACSNDHSGYRDVAVDTTAAAAAEQLAIEPDGAHVDAALTPADWESLQARIQYLADSVDRRLRRVPSLSGQERTRLRRDVNAIHIARAQQLGIRPGGNVDRLVQDGRLVRLADSTEYWVVRDLDYSLPYVIPSTESLLLEIGRRFHARLDSLGVPRYRLDITSVLRTPDRQAALRKANSNAAGTASSHEFGTTVDLAYRRYAPPAPKYMIDAGLDARGRLLSDSMLVETGRLRGAELQAVLGRVLAELQSEGKVLVRMERRQTVYHITAARQLPRKGRVAE